ncbi:uncharacterized protein J3R85_000091 [Psidium guajava]|nr:uncharacterized protein J3R85_000091 [Psidium guajava]
MIFRSLGRQASCLKWGLILLDLLLAETTILWEPTLEAEALCCSEDSIEVDS